MSFKKWFLGLFRILVFDTKSEPSVERYPSQKLNRIHVKDVKVGEKIQIEWYKIKGGIGYLKCLSNDPETNKILLEVHWSNSVVKEKVIFNYNDIELSNFHLLNQQQKVETKKEDNDFDVATLQKKLNEALEKEEYEKADELQDKINKILNGGNI